MSPRDLADSDDNNQLIHVTLNSALFGFLEDMYIISEPYELVTSTESKTVRKLSVQSQIRIGSNDFDQNYEHVNEFLDCLNDTFENSNQQPAPCSQ